MSLLNSSNNQCQYCLRTYRLKKNYNNHIVSCEFFHSIQSKTHDEFQDSIETIPNQRNMFNLLKLLAIKCGVLEKEITHLKQNTQIRQKKQIMEYLNEKKNVCNYFVKWYKETEITEEDMKISMQQDLTKGIINILKNKLTNLRDNTTRVPICYVKEKPNTIYIYDRVKVSGTETVESNKNEWKIATNDDLEKLVSFYSHEILKVFVKWQKENLVFFMANAKNKDLEIEYMSKISGIKNPVEKRVNELKKWLYVNLQEESQYDS